MARSVNITHTPWQATGQNVSTPQFASTFTVEWLDDQGAPHSDTRVVQFPNVLAQLPAAWVMEVLFELIIRALRKRLGIDP